MSIRIFGYWMRSSSLVVMERMERKRSISEETSSSSSCCATHEAAEKCGEVIDLYLRAPKNRPSRRSSCSRLLKILALIKNESKRCEERPKKADSMDFGAEKNSDDNFRARMNIWTKGDIIQYSSSSNQRDTRDFLLPRKNKKNHRSNII
jgi:hypothetical protein